MTSRILNLDIDNRVISKDIARLTNQIWKLIPMREKDEDWRKQLNTVQVEVVGLYDIFFNNELEFLQINSKISGLKIVEDVDFDTYRRTIFELISLLQKDFKHE